MSTQVHWTTFIEDITSSEEKHYLWLRSLSYLEYIGYRKMVKALGYQGVNHGVFHHLSDEIRHSFMLKELAEKGLKKPRQGNGFQQSLMDIAESYFQDVDSEVEKWIQATTGEEDSFLCYMSVSYIIEKRAMTIYPQYYAQLREAPLKYIIQKIIKDEREHLNYLEDQIKQIPQFPILKDSHLLNFEESRFTQYLQQFQDCLCSESR